MIEGKRIVAIIPARGGSKGVLRKNLRKFNGQTLLSNTIKSAIKSKYIDRVIVSSEDAEIIQEALGAGSDVPFVRPQDLAADDTPTIDSILHALNQIENYDYVLILQVTSPLRLVDDIDNCIKFCIEKDINSCVSVCESPKHPYWMFSIEENAKLRPIVSDIIPGRRQDLEPVYVVNGAIYMSKTEWLKETKSFISKETSAFLMPKERSIDIDNEFDFVIAEASLKYLSDGS